MTGATDRCAVDDRAAELRDDAFRGVALGVAEADRITRAAGEELIEVATLADVDRATTADERDELEETGRDDDPGRSDHAAATRAEKS